MNKIRPRASSAALQSFLILFLLAASVLSVQGQLMWSQLYGGPHADGGWSLGLCPDGDYVAAGYTVRGQGSDIYLLKINSSGGMVWSRIMGGSEDDSATALQTVSDGIVLAGSTESYSVGGERLWVAKVDYNGSLIWERSYGGFVTSSGDGAWSIRETTDGYVITGYTRSDSAGGKDLWLLRLDSFGMPVWSERFGGSGDDVGFSVLPHPIGYVAAGYSRSFGGGDEDVYVVMTDEDGSLLWNRTFGDHGDSAALSMVRVDDGLVLAGRTEVGGDRDVLLMKISDLGDEIWSRNIGGPGNQSALAVTTTEDGGLLLTGWTETPSKNRDLLLIRTDSDGLLQWSRTFGGLGPDMGTSLLLTGTACLVLGISSMRGSEDLWLLNLSLDDILPDAAGSVQTAGRLDETISLIGPDGSENHAQGESSTAQEAQEQALKMAAVKVPSWRSSKEITIPNRADDIKKFFKS